MSVAAVVFTCQPKIAAALDITNGPCVPAPGKRQRLVSVHRQQHGDRPEHLTALYQVLTDRPEAEAWADVKRTGEATLARFSDDYRAALASLRSGQQDPPGKLTEFAIRWMEVTDPKIGEYWGAAARGGAAFGGGGGGQAAGSRVTL